MTNELLLENLENYCNKEIERLKENKVIEGNPDSILRSGIIKGLKLALVKINVYKKATKQQSNSADVDSFINVITDDLSRLPYTKVDIISTIENNLPSFASAANNQDGEKIILTQDAFNLKESWLLGAAIKYAGFKNKSIEIIP